MDAPAKLVDLELVFGNVVTSIMALVGIVLFIMLIVGGLRYITSGGDPKATESAQKTLTYALYGFILIVLSYLILTVIENFTGAQITQFKIFQSN